MERDGLGGGGGGAEGGAGAGDAVDDDGSLGHGGGGGGECIVAFGHEGPSVVVKSDIKCDVIIHSLPVRMLSTEEDYY